MRYLNLVFLLIFFFFVLFSLVQPKLARSKTPYETNKGCIPCISTLGSPSEIWESYDEVIPLINTLVRVHICTCYQKFIINIRIWHLQLLFVHNNFCLSKSGCMLPVQAFRFQLLELVSFRQNSCIADWRHSKLRDANCDLGV